MDGLEELYHTSSLRDLIQEAMKSKHAVTQSLEKAEKMPEESWYKIAKESLEHAIASLSARLYRNSSTDVSIALVNAIKAYKELLSEEIMKEGAMAALDDGSDGR
jgi:hypothetical protein